MFTFIPSFLANRTYEVVIGDKRGPRQENETGFRQGAVISPMLFNIVMTGLAYELEKNNELRFAIYADDVSFWIREIWIRDQKDILQTALNVTQAYMKKGRNGNLNREDNLRTRTQEQRDQEQGSPHV